MGEKMTTCKNCGTELVEGAKFCKNCGSEIIQEEMIDATHAKTCPECGAEIEEGMKFCKNCGFKISADDGAKTKSCSKCGFEMGEDMIFCPECGTSTSEVPQVNDGQVANYSNKSPVFAAILSFFIIGLGQVYLGLTKKGIILFVLAIVSGILMLILVGVILWLLVWGYAIYDAYNSANKINEGIAVEDTLDLHNLF